MKQTTGIQQGQYLSFLNSVPTVDVLNYVPTFQVEDIDLKYLDKNQDNFLEIEKKDRGQKKNSFGKGMDMLNKVMKLRADNPYQQGKIDNLKNSLGLDEQAFDIKDEDLGNDAMIKALDTKFARMSADQEFQNIIRDQQMSDLFAEDIKSICAGKDANGELCRMAREKLKEYYTNSDGQLRGDALRAAAFKPINVLGVLKKDLDTVPVNAFREKVKTEGGLYVAEEWEQRSRELVTDIINARLKDEQFLNNLYANGFKTPADIERLKQSLIDAWTQRNLKDVTFKGITSGRSRSSSSSSQSQPTGLSTVGSINTFEDALKARYNETMASKETQFRENNLRAYRSLLNSNDVISAARFLDKQGVGAQYFWKFDQALANNETKDDNINNIPFIQNMYKDAVERGYLDGVFPLSSSISKGKRNDLLGAFKGMIGKVDLKDYNAVKSAAEAAGVGKEVRTIKDLLGDTNRLANAIYNIASQNEIAGAPQQPTPTTQPKQEIKTKKKPKWAE